MERCKSSLQKLNSFTILPYIGSSKKLKTYMEEKETIDLQKIQFILKMKRLRERLSFHNSTIPQE